MLGITVLVRIGTPAVPIGASDAIAKNAKQMQGLAQIEEFVRGRNEDYRTQLKSFHFANRELIRMSEEENVDGAALAYVQLTLSCVDCHKHLRNQAK